MNPLNPINPPTAEPNSSPTSPSAPADGAPQGPRPVIVGVDGSDGARLALRWAAYLATLLHAPLEAVIAWEPVAYWAPDGAASALVDRVDRSVLENRLAEEVDRAFGDSPPAGLVQRVAIGGAVATLVEAGSEAALVVVGSRGLDGFTGLLLGSTSSAVALHAPCPVLVVHGTADPLSAGDDNPLAKVVVGVDGSSVGDSALRTAWALAEAAGGAVEAVIAWQNEPDWVHYRGEAREPWTAERFAEQTADTAIARALGADGAGGRVRRVTAHGAPGKVLVDASADAQLLVVGSRGHGGFVGMLLGSVSRACMRHAQCPVLIVHAAAPGRELAGRAP